MKEFAQRYRDCADQGMTQGEAAKALGVSRQAVSRMARVHSIEFRSDVPRRLSEMDAAIFRDMAAQGLTIHQASEISGISYKRIHYLGIKWKRKPLPAPVTVKIVEMALQGMNAVQIAKSLGINRTSVYRARGKCGFRLARAVRENREREKQA